VAAASAPEADLGERLVSLVSERTGYPPDMLDLDANLEADLSIDSIKRVEIISAFRRAVRPSLEKPPPWFMERMAAARTIRSILEGMQALLQQPVQGDSAPPAAQPAPAVAPFPPRRAPRAPRCVPVAVEAPLEPGPPLELRGRVVVLSDDGEGAAAALAARLESLGGRTTLLGAERLATRESAAAALDEVRRSHGAVAAMLHLLPLRSAPSFPGLDDAAWKRHCDEEVRGALHLIQAVAPELGASSQEAPFFFAAVTRGGGAFGDEAEQGPLHPWRGGLAGLLKTAAREWEQARFRAIDLDGAAHAALAELLCLEWAASGPTEVGYRAGRRMALRLRRADLEGEPTGGGDWLDAQSVVLLTGGARGITAEIALEIAQRARPLLILVGRSPLPSADEEATTASLEDAHALRRALLGQARAAGERVTPREIESRLASLLAAREIRRTLRALEEAGARAEYVCCDTRDVARLERLVLDVRRRHGRLDAVVHGAGVIEDQRLLDKSAESFDRVVETKLGAMLALTRALDPGQLEHLMLFSSVAGFFGNPGQGDYAAANEMLNRMASRLARLWPARVVAMNWGPWAGAGMVTPQVERLFRARGVELVGVEAGRRAAWQELLAGRGEAASVVIGGGPWLEEAEQPQSAVRAARATTPLLARHALRLREDGALEAEVTLDPARDVYLRDHCIDARPVLPLTVALEMMAELAAAARPEWHVAQVRGLRQLGGVAVEGERRALVLRAERAAHERDCEDWRVRLADPALRGRTLYEATVRLAAQLPTPPPAPEPIQGRTEGSASELYRRWLFHGPLFQVIREVRGAGPAGIDASGWPSSPQQCLGGDTGAGWLIDPIVLDAGPQLAIVWSRATFDTTPLPNRVGVYHRYGALGGESLEVRLRVTHGCDGSTLLADVLFVRGGQVVGRMESLEGSASARLNRLAQESAR
jgi:NAD(P)-dependent dehydrogenase (short-subunit alcohol dehydrogenase family)